MKVNIINGQLTENFNLHEFVDNFSGEAELYIDERFIKFVNLLQRFRNWYRRPVNINSCYRSVECNDHYGGSKNSSHLVSLAVDFNLPDAFHSYSEIRKEGYLANVRTYWEKICDEADVFHQVNFYDTYVHLGIGIKSDSFLDERSA